MDITQLPVQIITQRMVKKNLSVYYPIVTGLSNPQAQQEINKAIMDLINKLITDQGYYENPQTTIDGWYDLKNNQKGILSLSIGNYAFAGGAHGMTVIKSLTFDVVTGKSYELSELFKPGADYVKVLSDIIALQIKAWKIPLLDGFKGIRPDQDFYIADKSLVIYFQLYEITAYYIGFPHFPIAVYSLRNLIKEDGPLDKMAVYS